MLTPVGETTLFKFQVIPNGVYVYVVDPQLSGEVKAEILKIELGRLIDRLRPRVVVLDMSAVKMISSVVIGTLVQLQRKLVSMQSELRQCCLPSVIESVYRTTRLGGELFLTYDTYEAAIGADSLLNGVRVR